MNGSWYTTNRRCLGCNTPENKPGAVGLVTPRSETEEPLPIRAAALSSLKAPPRPVRAPVDPAGESEVREVSGR
jgi:hypothetical protein